MACSFEKKNENCQSFLTSERRPRVRKTAAGEPDDASQPSEGSDGEWVTTSSSGTEGAGKGDATGDQSNSTEGYEEVTRSSAGQSGSAADLSDSQSGSCDEVLICVLLVLQIFECKFVESGRFLWTICLLTPVRGRVLV